MNDPSDPANPLQGLLGDLLKMIGGAQGGTDTWREAARALAQGVASEGSTEANPDPIERIQLEELARVAELHVAEATGLDVGRADRALSVMPLGRGAWALRALDAWSAQIEAMVAAQAGADPGAALGVTLEEGGLGELLGRFASTMGPVLVGMQFGSAAGHLARRALGRYALAVPWPDAEGLVVVPENIAAFAQDWSLPVDQAQLWACVHELTANAVLTLPHVAEAIGGLLTATAADAVAAQQGLAQRLGGEAADPAALQGILSDPESLLADLLTPGQRRTSSQLVALTTAVGAYVDHVTGQVAAKLVGSAATLTEAWYRFRTAEDAGEQAAAALLGLEVGREQVDRGAAFVRGVLERAGEEGLGRLWTSARTLPTPAELDAPGLWLERIDLPEADEEA